MQIQVTVANDHKRTNPAIWLEDTTTLKAAFAKAGIEIGNGMIQLNGETLDDADINKTFAQCGVTGRTATLSATVKSVGN